MSNFIANQFKRPSGFMGKIVSLIMKKRNISSYDKIVDKLNIQPKDRILEIGYGHGVGINRIVSEFDCYITGIDFSELMYAEATQRNQRHIENKRVELFFGDFLNSDFKPDSFDKVFCINVVYFWDTLEIPFSKIYTYLKADGMFCFFMEHRDNLNRLKFTDDDVFNKYSIEHVVSVLESVGFREISFTNEHGYFVLCHK
jgi:cyclopropane fatty-acyl-phospholipid synthase-like methyltransferase